MKKMLVAAALAATSLSAVPANAAITWTDWTQTSTVGSTTTVIGNAGGTGVTFTGNGVAFVQTSGGTDYWHTGNAWDSTVAAPTGSDIIALDAAGTKTITFSSAVQTAYIALMSWQGQSFTSTSNFSFVGLVRGCGYWGCGTPTTVTANSFTTGGELHGVIQFSGPITSIQFVDGTNENWHGITVGIDNSAVPEPATWAMMIGGFGAIGGAMRMRRRRTSLATA
ncbi:MAG: PEPxxWA-CTERM sorting domain-containing protein [Pseudomonadota bacterium]